MDMEPMHDTGARDTGASKSEGRLKLMLSKRHAKKLKKFPGKGGPKGGKKYDGKGGPTVSKSKFGSLDTSKLFKKGNTLSSKP